MELNIQIKQPGNRTNKITTAKLLLKETPHTLKELLIYTIKANLALHNQKRKQLKAFEAGDLSAAILYTDEEIKDAASSGKIDFGFLKSSATVSEAQAIETALQTFDDGLIAIFIDEQRYENVEEPLALTGTETITFVKLTMLSGRMW